MRAHAKGLTVIYISEFQNKLAWKFDISVSLLIMVSNFSINGSGS
jgi:hypothetical protein